MRIDLPQPFDVESMLGFLSARAVDGLEWFDGREYARGLDLPSGPGVVHLVVNDDAIEAEFEVTHPDDLSVAVDLVRRVFDLDADVGTIDAHLSADPLLANLVAQAPGLRLPGTFDPFEASVRAIVGQQISVAGARTVLGRIVAAHGEPLDLSMAREFGLRHTFPTPFALAGADPAGFSMPRARAHTINRVAAAIDSGELVLDRDHATLRADLLTLPGIGPWTADYIRLRALGDPDVLLSTDLVIARVLERDAVTPEQSAAWAPWRSYATLHLWRSA